MAIIRERKIKNNTLESIANQMLIAARTAPKGKGKDTLELIIISENDISNMSEFLFNMGEKSDVDFYKRDVNNLLKSGAILLIGTEIKTLGLNEICQLCGFKNCAEKEKHPNTPCVFNTSDLSIAVGSAVSLAADLRVDNRIMFSLGKAAIKMKLFEKDIKIAYGIPISASSKNVFFDRK
jgi:uncharacterized ferredoxin-like protein